MFDAADGNFVGSLRRKYQNYKGIHLKGNVYDQQCCSFVYSILMSKKCCCAWMDNNEIFRASFKKSDFFFPFFLY